MSLKHTDVELKFNTKIRNRSVERSTHVLLVNSTLLQHERVCKFRPYICPYIECDHKLAADAVVVHVSTAHRLSNYFLCLIKDLRDIDHLLQVLTNLSLVSPWLVGLFH